MADRFKHDDSLKAQDVELRGKRLQRRRMGRMGNEAARMAEKGYIDEDKSGIIERRGRAVAEVAGDMGKDGRQVQAGSYLKKKRKGYEDMLEEAGRRY